MKTKLGTVLFTLLLVSGCRGTFHECRFFVFPPGTYGPNMSDNRSKELLYVGKLCCSNNSKRRDADGNRIKTRWDTTVHIKNANVEDWTKVARWEIPAYHPNVAACHMSPTNVILKIEEKEGSAVWLIELVRPHTNNAFTVGRVEGDFREK